MAAGAELTDAEVFGAPAAQPAAPAPPTGDGTVVDARTQAALNAAQTAAYRAHLAAGKFDPAAEPGTEGLPLHQVNEGEEPEAGKWFVDLGGNIRQAGAAVPAPAAAAGPKEMSDAEVFGSQPPGAAMDGSVMDDRPVSQVLGFKEGVNTVARNVADIAGLRIPGLPTLPGASDALMHPLALIAHGISNVIRGQTDQAEQTYRPGKIGKVAGQVAASAPFAIDAELPFVTSALQRAFAPAVTGGLQGFLSSESTDPMGRILDTGMGAAGGKLGDTAMKGLSSVVLPSVRAPAQWAMDNGIRLTPGAISGGIMNGVEHTAAKGTIAGSLVSSAQRQMLTDANLSAIRNALAPAGLSLPSNIKAGTAAIDQAHTLFGDAYDAVTPKLTVHRDPVLAQQLADHSQASVNLDPALATRYQGLVDKVGDAFDASGAMSEAEMRRLDGALGEQQRRFGRSDDPFHQEYADAVGGLQESLRDAVERSNPDQAAQLAALNSGYAQLVRLDKAAVLAKQNGGVWTPDQLMQAVTSSGMDNSVRRGSSARGRALLQDWAQSAKDVLPNTMPNAGNFLTHLPELLVTAGVGHEAIMPAIGNALMGEGALAAMYTPPAQSLIRAAMTKRPSFAKDIAERLDAIRPALGYVTATAAPTVGRLVLPQLPGQVSR